MKHMTFDRSAYIKEWTLKCKEYNNMLNSKKVNVKV